MIWLSKIMVQSDEFTGVTFLCDAVLWFPGEVYMYFSAASLQMTALNLVQCLVHNAREHQGNYNGKTTLEQSRFPLHLHLHEERRVKEGALC